MADIRNKTASIYIDDTAAQTALQNLQQKADAYNKTIDDTRKKQKALTDEIARAKDAGENYSKQQQQLSKLNTELGKSEKALLGNVAQQKALQQQIDSKVGPSLKQQQALVSRLVNEYKLLGNNSHLAAEKLKEIEGASKALTVMKDRLNAVQQVQRQTVKESDGFGKIFERVLEYTGAYAIITKVGEGLHDLFVGSIDEAIEAEEKTARFKATLDNLGKTEVFDRLKQKADELAAKFKYIDNDDIVAVFEKLIDYGKLTEDQIKSLTPVIIDFAAKQRIPIEQATDVITKSLEGNAKGLKTFGINLSEASTPAERLKIIMTELKDKVDGAADAFGSTTAGKIAIAKQSYKDLKEEIGTNLLPAMNKLLEWVNGAIKGLPLVAAQIKNTVSDVFTFFTEGPWAAQLAKAQRMIEQMKQTESDVVKKQVSEFEDKSAEEVHTEIDRINQVIAVKQQYIDVLKKAKYFDPTHFTKEDQKNLDDYTQGVRVLKGTIDGLYKVQDQKTNKQPVLGNGDINYDPAAAKEAERKRLAEQNKILEDQKKFLEELRKLNVEYELLNESDKDREIQQVIEKYNALRAEAHGNAELLKQEEQSLGNAILQVRQKFAQKELEEQIKQDEEKEKKRQAFLDKQLKEGTDRLNSIAKEVQDNAAIANERRLDDLKLQELKSHGKKRLDAELAILNEEEQQELNKKDVTEEKKALIEEQYRQKRRDAEIQFWAGLFQQLLSFGQSISEIFSLSAQVRTNKEQAQLQQEKKNNDDRKKSYDTLLNRKVISQQQYNQKQAEADDAYNKKAAALKKKEWIRQQKADVIGAEISTAQAILSALTTQPFWLGLILAGVAAVKGGEQVKEIKSRPVPEFEKGGALTGPRHSEGGMPVINPRTGRKEAEVEGGEVILSRKTVAKNKPVVDALLYNSMYKQGATIDPWFKNRTYKSIDFSGISKSIQNVRHYESGGVFTTNKGDTPQQQQQPIVVPAMTEQQEVLMNALLSRLNQPFKGYVVYQDIKDASDTIDSIKGAATFGKK